MSRNPKLEELIRSVRAMLWEKNRSEEPPSRSGALERVLGEWLDGHRPGRVVAKGTTTTAVVARRHTGGRTSLLSLGEALSMRNEFPAMRGPAVDRKRRLAAKFKVSPEVTRRILKGEHPLVRDKNLPSLVADHNGGNGTA